MGKPLVGEVVVLPWPAVLEMPPVISPVAAVRASIMSDAKARRK